MTKANTTAAPVAPKGKATRAATVSPIKYALQDFAMPTSGNMLFAHTAVFLKLSAMEVNAMPRAQVVKSIGARAVSYHVGKGNFEKTAKGLILTAKGLEFFAKRTIDPELHAAYEEVLTTGKLNATANVKTASSVIDLSRA